MKSPYSARRKIVWKNIRGFKSAIAFWIATASGAGLFPVAPGTMGTLVGLPIAYFSRTWVPLERAGLLLVLFLLGTWSATVFDELMGTHDNQNIVIDEVVGVGITVWTAGDHAITWVAAFLAFRFFDVLKPPPVREVDRWSQKQTSAWMGGFGVMADDLIAGFQGLGVIWAFQLFHIL